MRERPFPTTVDLALTGKCNLRCKHCNTSDTWNADNELTFDEILGVLDDLKENKLFNLNLFGGEPFCYPEIFELLKALNSYPMRVSILTNGTLIDEKAVEYIKGLRFLHIVQVSIDGSTSEIHDWQRGEGSFDRSIRAVKLMIEKDVPVTIKAIINSHNRRDIENMLKMALDMGLDGMDFGDAVECGRAAVYSNDMSLEGRVYEEIMNNVFDLVKKYPDASIGGTLGQKVEMLTDFYRNGPGCGGRGTFSTCPAGQNMLSIRSDGKVVPCSAFWTLVCGDVKEQPLRDIWDNSEILNRIRALADEDLTKYGAECAKCDYLSYCNGGCRASAYYTDGMKLEGIDKGTCLTFSDIYGFRLKKEKVMSINEKRGRDAVL
jgi:Fe-coproporphyrin III synthase